MKKSALLRLLIAMCAFALFASACGGSDGDSSDSASDDAETTEESDATDADDASSDADDAAATDDDDAEDGDGDGDDVELAQADLLSQVQARGTLNCGVSGSATAFSVTQADGSQEGFDADYCRAAAAAILGDATAVNFVPLAASERFTAVQTGDVDVLMRNTTWTQSRDSDVGMDFGPTTYFDGQQLMARASDGFSVDSGVADVDGAVVCTNAGTTTEKNIADAADAEGITITLSTFDDWNTAVENFINGGCDVLTTDGSGLVGVKAEQQTEGEEWIIFPSAPISKEPLGPTYGQNDSKFADAINWTVYATMIADEYGINQSNVDDALASPANAEVERLLGGEGELQTAMGLSADAFYQVIKQIGNYNDIYERHLVPVGLKREGSNNALWTDGGLLYAPPAR